MATTGIVNGGLSGLDTPTLPLPNSGLSGASAVAGGTTTPASASPAPGQFGPTAPPANGQASYTIKGAQKLAPDTEDALLRAIGTPGSDYSKLLPMFGGDEQKLREAVNAYSSGGADYLTRRGQPLGPNNYVGYSDQTTTPTQGQQPILTAPPSGIVGAGVGGTAVNTFGSLPDFDPNNPFKNTPTSANPTPNGGIGSVPSFIPAPGTAGSITEKPFNPAAPFDANQFDSTQTPTTGSPSPSAPAAVGPGAPSVPKTLDQLATDYNPTLRTVQGNETVQGQLGNILKTGNPLLEAAKARAMKQASARGLVNSSIAAQSGEEAMVNTALPIAQQDAATYNNVAQANQDVQNLFVRDKYATAADMLKQYETYKQNNAMFDKDAELKRYLNDSTISSEEKRTAMNNAASVLQTKISAAAQVQNANTAAESSRYGADVGAATSRANAATAAATSKYGTDVGAQTQKQLADIQSATSKYVTDTNAKNTMDVNLLSAGNASRTNFGNQLTQILTSPNGTPESTQAAIDHLTAFYTGNPVKGFNIDFGSPSSSPATTGSTESTGVVNSAVNNGVAGLYTGQPNPNQP